MSEKTSQGASDKFQSGKSHAVEAARDLREAATAKAQDLRDAATAKAHDLRETLTGRANEYREHATRIWSDTAVRARSLQEDGEDYIRENPLQAVGIALAVGFALGLILRR